MKRLIIILVLIIASFFVFLGLNKSISKTKEKAILINQNGVFNLVLKKERKLMTHDPLSLFKSKKYLDSTNFIIPRKSGVVNGGEISTKPGFYKLIGTIRFEQGKVIIDLYYDNLDNKTKQPSGWNGVYFIEYK